MAEKGGYDYNFVDGEPSNDCICLICMLVCHEAQQVPCCGKIFCHECLEIWKKKADNFKCPNCDKDLTRNYMYFDDERADHEINQLQVYCDNHKTGCDWKGLLQEVTVHQKSCPHNVVKCPNNCDKSMKALQLKDHLHNECPQREVKCPHCNSMGRYNHITDDHLRTCPDLEIDCPTQHCTQQAKRKDMASHQLSCPKESIHCEYVDMGCSHICLREEMPRHAAQEVHSHLQLTTEITRSLLERKEFSKKALTFKMSGVSHFLDTKKPWYSPAFYSSPGGYKMRLSVKVMEEGRRLSIFDTKECVPEASVSLHLMPGKYDGVLDWPMRGEFTVTLLNQIRNRGHIDRKITCLSQTSVDYNSRVADGHVSPEFGSCKFSFAADILSLFFRPVHHYCPNDTFFFGVTTVNLESATKPWLADAL